MVISGHCVLPLPSSPYSPEHRNSLSLMKWGRLPQLQCCRHKAHYPNFFRNILTPGRPVRVSQLRAASQNHTSLQSSSMKNQPRQPDSWLYRHGEVNELCINSTFLPRQTMSGPYGYNIFPIPKRAERKSKLLQTNQRLANFHRLLLLAQSVASCASFRGIKWKIITYLNRC